MLVNTLMRPFANAVCRIPARNTSAVVGARSRHVSVAGESNIANKTLAIDIPQVRKMGRPKHSWAGQMRQRQQRFGLKQQKKNEIANARPVTRSMGMHI